MKILFVSSLFPNSLQPNKGIFSFQIVREMSRLSELRVIAPVPSIGVLSCLDSLKNYRTNLPISDIELIDGIHVDHPRYFAIPKMGFLHPATLYTSLVPLINKIHSAWGIDVVNCHWIFPDGVAVQRVCAAIGIPVMLTPLGSDIHKYGGFRLRRSVLRNALLGADRVSVLNSPMWEVCKELGVSLSRLTIIPNGVDTAKFTLLDRTESRKALGLDDSGRIILFVGNLDPVKGIDTLLRALAILNKINKNKVKLIIIGSGYLEQKLKQLANILGIIDSVFFVGSVKHENIPIWMNAADCLCLPSISEGHPNVMMESLACGTPVVASSVGSIPDFIDNESGFTSRPSDFEGLAANLANCMKIEYNRVKVRNRVADYTWENCAKNYLQELQKCVSTRHRA
jgi:glycosyltransferase involved in cell wall biosynthesis